MVEKCGRCGIGKHTLSRRRIARCAKTSERRERLQVAQSWIASDPQHGGLEVRGFCVDTAEKGGEFQLSDAHVEAGLPKPRLNHLLQSTFAAADGEQLELNGSSSVSRQVGQLSNRHISWCRWGNWTSSRRSEAVNVAINQLAPVYCLTHPAAYGNSVERLPPRIEDNALRPQQRETDHGQVGVTTDEFRMCGLYAREVELAGRQGRQLRGGLIHDHNDEALQLGWSSERGREIAVRSKDPAAVRLVRHEAEGTISHWSVVPGCLPQSCMWRRTQKMGREDREIGQDIRKAWLRL